MRLFQINPPALFTVERAETACGPSTSLLDRRGGTTAETPPHVLAGNQLSEVFSPLYAGACLLTTAFKHVVRLGTCTELMQCTANKHPSTTQGHPPPSPAGPEAPLSRPHAPPRYTERAALAPNGPTAPFTVVRAETGCRPSKVAQCIAALP